MSQINLPNVNITGDNLWSQVEANDNAIKTVVNGDLDNGNIAANADINGAKLLDGSVTGAKLLNGSVTGAKLANGTIKSGKLGLTSYTDVGASVFSTADHVWASVASVVPGTYLAIGNIDLVAASGSGNLRFDNSTGGASFQNATISANGARSVSAIITVTSTATIRLRGTAAAGFGSQGSMTLFGIGA